MKDLIHQIRLAKQALGPWSGMRFAARQLISKDDERIGLSVFENGRKYRMFARSRSTDLLVFTQIFTRAEYEFSQWTPYYEYTKSCYEQILSAGRQPLIIDAGANAGYSAIWFALRFPRARILAVEPDPENYKLLVENVASFEGITPVEAALWDEPARLSVVDGNSGAWGRRFHEFESGSGVATVTVPELLENNPESSPFIMKIDIEGAETKLLRSNTAWVATFPLIIFEPHDMLFPWYGTWQGSSHSFFSALSSCKREYLIRGENIFAFRFPEEHL